MSNINTSFGNELRKLDYCLFENPEMLKARHFSCILSLITWDLQNIMSYDLYLLMLQNIVSKTSKTKL